jgi:hypothetical protein
VGIPAEFDPQVTHTHHLAQAFSPEQVGAALIKRYDIVVADLGQDPFLFTPYTGPIRPFSGFTPVLEELFPILRATLCKGLHIMSHFKKRAAVSTAIDDRVQRVFGPALRVDALKPGSICHKRSSLLIGIGDYEWKNIILVRYRSIYRHTRSMFCSARPEGIENDRVDLIEKFLEHTSVTLGVPKELGPQLHYFQVIAFFISNALAILKGLSFAQ